MNITRTQPRDCWNLAYDLRECDRREIELGSGRDPHDVLMESWAASKPCQTVWAREGIVACIWGVTPLEGHPGIGSIWMLGSDEIESIPLSFLRACKPAIEQAHALYPTLACAAWRENALHLKWLRWLGFTQNDVGHPHFIPHYRHV